MYGQGCLFVSVCNGHSSSELLRWGSRESIFALVRGISSRELRVAHFALGFWASTHLWASWGWCINLVSIWASIGHFVEGAPACLNLEFSPLCLGSRQKWASAPTPTSIGHLVPFREATRFKPLAGAVLRATLAVPSLEVAMGI